MEKGTVRLLAVTVCWVILIHDDKDDDGSGHKDDGDDKDDNELNSLIQWMIIF